MIERRTLGTRKCALFLVFLLLAATSFTLLHWHKTRADQGCQLCHIRHLPSLNSSIALAYGDPNVSKQYWHCDDSGEELKTCLPNTPSRSPPVSMFFLFLPGYEFRCYLKEMDFYEATYHHVDIDCFLSLIPWRLRSNPNH